MNTEQKKSPGLAAEALRSIGIERSKKLTPLPRTRPAERYYIVVEGGQETRLDQVPKCRYLTVQVICARGCLFEETRTWFRKVNLGNGRDTFAPRPRGERWKRHRDAVKDVDTDRLFAIWRRPLIKGGGK